MGWRREERRGDEGMDKRGGVGRRGEEVPGVKVRSRKPSSGSSSQSSAVLLSSPWQRAMFTCFTCKKWC